MDKKSVDTSLYAPAFEVEISGKKLSAEEDKCISSITIEKAINKTNNFRFVVQDEMKEGKLKWLGSDLFKFGNDVSIKLGYVGNMPLMMEGQIQNISANFFTGGVPNFTVEGVDNAYKFLMEQGALKVFKEKKDSDIAKEIAKMANLKAEVEDTKTVHSVRKKKAGENYLKFLEYLTSQNKSFEFFISEGKLFFVSSRKDRDSILSLGWGRDLISFRPKLNTSQAITEVIVRGWDRQGKKTIEAKVKAGEEKKQDKQKKSSSQIARDIFGDVVKVITDKPVRSVEEAKRIATAELEKAGDSLITGSCETIGIPGIKQGVCLDLENVGSWFNGKYYVEKVTHKIDTSGYRTTFDVRRNTI